MKIVKTKNDIDGDMYCVATKENYEKLIEFGYKRFDRFGDKFYNLKQYKKDDVIQILCGELYWYDNEFKKGIEFEFAQNQDLQNLDFSVSKLGFIEPTNFEANIFSIYQSKSTTEYIGCINRNIPAKWDCNGNCLNISPVYNLHKEYKQVLYTKENSPGCFPKQKFKVSCTECVSESLEKCGWRRATNDEIKYFLS